MAVGDAHSVPRIDLELTSGCDHACGHCYNVWNADGDDPQGGYPRGRLRTAEYLAMVDAVLEQSGAQHVTLTGGEPLLRKDAMEIVEHVCRRVPSVLLITNGSHITPERARLFAAWRLRAVQLTLLAGDRETHDRLKGAVCFDDTLRAALDLRDAGVAVQVCFVSTAENWRHFEPVLELCYVLGVRSVSYNRMSPTGWAIHHLDRLLPTVEQVEHNLESAERVARALGIRVATAMPIPPCLVRLERYPWVQFGFCSTGSHSPNLVVDPIGNVRSCNLSRHVMGNATDEPWAEIHADPYLHGFRERVPEMCRGCAYERSCQGGCKESAFATFGDHRHPEPFLHQARGGSLLQIGEPRR